MQVGDYLAIHAGVYTAKHKKTAEAWTDALELAEQRGMVDQLPLLNAWRERVEAPKERLYAYRCAKWLETAVPYGAVVGVAQLLGIETEAPVGDPWWCGPLGWRLGNVIAVDPIPCRGAQGLWGLPPDVLATVRERWKVVQEKARGGE